MAAEFGGDQHAQQARGGHGLGKVSREATALLDLISAGTDLVAQAFGGGDRVHGHPFRRQSAARLLRCMFDDPPTMGMLSRSRTLRSMS